MNNNLRVIIADENPDFIEQLCSFLKEKDSVQVVGTVSDGLELVALTKDLQPDIVVTDALLPHKDGLAAIRMLDQFMGKNRDGVLSEYENVAPLPFDQVEYSLLFGQRESCCSTPLI